MDWHTLLVSNWHVKFVCILLIWAAYIDGKELRVPNWLTFPMVLSGLVYSAWVGGWSGLSDGLIGMCVGLATLLPLYAVGGMGRRGRQVDGRNRRVAGRFGDLEAFVVSVIVGAVMAIAMVAWRKRLEEALRQLLADHAGIHDGQEARPSCRRSPPSASRRCCCCRTAFPSASGRSPTSSTRG